MEQELELKLEGQPVEGQQEAAGQTGCCCEEEPERE